MASLGLADRLKASGYEDRIEQVRTVEGKNIVKVNGNEIVVSSASEKPNRSFWVAWMYIFDVSEE